MPYHRCAACGLTRYGAAAQARAGVCLPAPVRPLPAAGERLATTRGGQR
jgi:hypothetical protein